ncbi:sensor histidine kinase [Larkinella soli]|uniref:sensor histidine kinase n=1 Tax=Larkinella soli TaxID=1770527 RepID=UPI000FFB4C72|nr:ATP-binding protein [Larkinella soli]
MNTAFSPDHLLEKMFGSVLETMLDGLSVYRIVRDENGALADLVYEYVSDQMLKDIGLTREQVIGKTQLQLFPGVRHSRFWSAYITVMQTGESQTFEDHYHYDGVDNHIRGRVSLVDADHLISAYQILNEVKSARIESEEQARLLSSVIHNSPNGIILADPIRNAEGRIVDFTYRLTNEFNARVVGMKLEDMIGKPIGTLFPGWQEISLFKSMVQVCETGRPIQYSEKYESFGINAWFKYYYVKHGDSVLMSFLDVTAIKQAQLEQERQAQALALANTELKRSNEYLQQFAYVASHDLQEPLRKIQSFSDILTTEYADGLPDKARQMLNRIQSAAGRMSQLVRDLLTYSRLSMMPSEFQMLDLNEVVDSIRFDQELAIGGSSASVKRGRLPSLPADPAQMYQLFQNLIGNALKYVAPKQAPRVSIESRLLPYREVPEGLLPDLPPGMPERDYWEIAVSDNGIGFDEKYLDRLFQMFQRLHGKTEFQGSGIGLAICKRVVENHQGAITARSRPGEGATFLIYLPAGTEPADPV